MRLGLTGHRGLELAHPATERAADLGQALGAEHQQQDYDEECDVEGVVEAHVLSLSLDDRLGAMAERPAHELRGDDQQQHSEGIAQHGAGQGVGERDAAGRAGE
jgi:hypothetical protein